MRRAAIAFVGLVAGIASCSSYGENVTDPGTVDGGGSSSSGTSGATDAATGDDGGHADLEAGVSEGGAGNQIGPTPTIVQLTSNALASASSEQLALAFDKTVGKGHAVLVFVSGVGAKVKLASIDNTPLAPIITSASQFLAHTALGGVVQASTVVTSRITITFDAPAGNPMAVAVELANIGSHTEITSAGTGNVTVGQVPTTPDTDLVIANVVGNGTAPVGPFNAKPLGQPISNSPLAMVSGWAIATAATSPNMSWKTDSSFQWDAIVIAFKPSPSPQL